MTTSQKWRRKVRYDFLTTTLKKSEPNEWTVSNRRVKKTTHLTPNTVGQYSIRIKHQVMPGIDVIRASRIQLNGFGQLLSGKFKKELEKKMHLNVDSVKQR
jgi:hypothetical protein